MTCLMVFALKKKREMNRNLQGGRGEECDVALLYRCKEVKVPLPCFASVFSVIWSEEIRRGVALSLD
jgi:hypothetical protein